jgi:hypothetical protein
MTSGSRYRGLFKFDVSAMPVTKIIVDKAELVLKTTNIGNSGGAKDVSVHSITAAWTTYAGWSSSSNSSSWIALGGDFTSNTITPSAAQFDMDVNSVITIELDPVVVQSWVTTPATNYGLILKSNDMSADNTCQIYSSGAADPANRPLLKVWYYTTE